MRNLEDDGSQRLVTALMPGALVPIHCHPNSTENLMIVCGKFIVITYDDNGIELECIHLDPVVGNFVCVIPTNIWHSVDVLEPSGLFEAKTVNTVR